MKKQAIALSLSGLCTAALAVASPPAHPGATATKDASFMKQAAADGMAEVELGELASTKATRPGVKEFAQRMVTDHSKVNGELKQLASREGVTLPAGPNAAERAEKQRLEKLSGTAFDDAYVTAMEKGHRSAVSLFSKEASSGSNDDVKQWAERTLPLLEEHLARAEKLAAKQAASANGGATTTTVTHWP
jgi:putative membrane protein